MLRHPALRLGPCVRFVHFRHQRAFQQGHLLRREREFLLERRKALQGLFAVPHGGFDKHGGQHGFVPSGVTRLQGGQRVQHILLPPRFHADHGQAVERTGVFQRVEVRLGEGARGLFQITLQPTQLAQVQVALRFDVRVGERFGKRRLRARQIVKAVHARQRLIQQGIALPAVAAFYQRVAQRLGLGPFAAVQPQRDGQERAVHLVRFRQRVGFLQTVQRPQGRRLQIRGVRVVRGGAQDGLRLGKRALGIVHLPQAQLGARQPEAVVRAVVEQGIQRAHGMGKVAHGLVHLVLAIQAGQVFGPLLLDLPVRLQRLLPEALLLIQQRAEQKDLHIGRYVPGVLRKNRLGFVAPAGLLQRGGQQANHLRVVGVLLGGPLRKGHRLIAPVQPEQQVAGKAEQIDAQIVPGAVQGVLQDGQQLLPVCQLRIDIHQGIGALEQQLGISLRLLRGLQHQLHAPLHGVDAHGLVQQIGDQLLGGFVCVRRFRLRQRRA